jgi:hypothetical protein
MTSAPTRATQANFKGSAKIKYGGKGNSGKMQRQAQAAITMEFLKLGNAKIRPENMALQAACESSNIQISTLHASGDALHAAEFNFSKLEKHEAKD